MFKYFTYTDIVTSVFVFIWVLFVLYCLKRYMMGMQDKKVYFRKLRKKFVVDVFLSGCALGLVIILFRFIVNVVT